MRCFKWCDVCVYAAVCFSETHLLQRKASYWTNHYNLITFYSLVPWIFRSQQRERFLPPGLTSGPRETSVVASWLLPDVPHPRFTAGTRASGMSAAGEPQTSCSHIVPAVWVTTCPPANGSKIRRMQQEAGVLVWGSRHFHHFLGKFSNLKHQTLELKQFQYHLWLIMSCSTRHSNKFNLKNPNLNLNI